MTGKTKQLSRDRTTSTTSSRARKRDMAIAYHEAGHAVARFDQGFSIRKVTIVPDPDRLGEMVKRKTSRRLRPDSYSTARVRRFVEREVIRPRKQHGGFFCSIQAQCAPICEKAGERVRRAPVRTPTSEQRECAAKTAVSANCDPGTRAPLRYDRLSAYLTCRPRGGRGSFILIYSSCFD
jgi:hypothetical protein